MAKRDVVIKLRLSAAEKAAWKAVADANSMTLADLIRRKMGGDAQEVKRDLVRCREGRRADPMLLATLVRSCSLLNQIAKAVDSRHQRTADALQVLIALRAIEEVLFSCRPGGGTSGESEETTC